MLLPVKRKRDPGAAEPAAEPAPLRAHAARPQRLTGLRDAVHSGGSADLARRLAAGRTTEMLAVMLDGHLFTALGDPQASSAAQLSSCRGLFAQAEGADVFIVATFARRGVPLADIATLGTPDADGRRFLEAVRTVHSGTLHNVGAHFVARVVEKRGVFCEPSEGAGSGTSDEEGLAFSCNAASHLAAQMNKQKAHEKMRTAVIHNLVPAAAKRHREGPSTHPQCEPRPFVQLQELCLQPAEHALAKGRKPRVQEEQAQERDGQ